MALQVRRAEAGDVDAIAALTRRSRHQLAAWEPDFWRVAPGADDLHPLWLGHLVTSPDAVARVVVDGDEVVACGFAVRQPAQWFADDLAVAGDRWADAGLTLLGAIQERPLLTCVPHRDRARATAAADAGWVHVSDYRVLRVEADGGTPAPTTTDRPATVPPAAAHTFGGPVDPAAPGTIVVRDGDGVAVASPPLPAPPIYDASGTSCVVDRVTGPDPGRLLDRVAAAAAAAGAAQLIVVCGATDDRLRGALDERRFDHPVEVHRAPERESG